MTLTKRTYLALLAVLTVGFSSTASADPVTWTLDYANPGNASSFSVAGTFVYDADSNVFSNINVTGVDNGGNNILDTTYTFTDPADANSASFFVLWDSLAADRTGAKRLQISVNPFALTNAGGVISLLAGPGPSIFAGRCLNAACTSITQYSVRISPDPANGTLVGVPVAPPDTDGDGVLDDDDFCSDTVIPEGVPTQMLLVNRWALTDDDGIFDTVVRGRARPDGYSIEDTAGCSCEQILAAQGLELEDGQTMFGCSISVMDDWVELVTP